MGRGTLFLVVGPSGAGKDSLIAGARTRLDGRYRFPRRVITRPADAGGEDHEAVLPDRFAALLAEQAFSLHWAAHGLSYGIRRQIEAELAEGSPVIVNVSRAVLDEARRRLAPVRILLVTAPPEVLASRIAARGRENAADAAQRLARAQAIRPEGPDVSAVVNDQDLGTGIARFIAAIEGHHRSRS